MEAARWLCDHKIVMVGTDTWATEVVPPEDPDRPFPVHQLLLVRHGIYNIENLDLEELARDKATSSRLSSHRYGSKARPARPAIRSPSARRMLREDRRLRNLSGQRRAAKLSVHSPAHRYRA